MRKLEMAMMAMRMATVMAAPIYANLFLEA